MATDALTTAFDALRQCALCHAPRIELAETSRKLSERKVVEKAKGILMKSRGMDEEAAYGALRKLAMCKARSHWPKWPAISSIWPICCFRNRQGAAGLMQIQRPLRRHSFFSGQVLIPISV